MKINFNFDMKLSKKMLFLVIFLCGAVFELIRGNYIIIPGISKVSSPSVSSTSGKAAEVMPAVTAGTAVITTFTETQLIKEKTNVIYGEISREFDSAFKQAKSLAELSHMSKSRIYRTLTDKEGGAFDSDAAEYAVDNLVCDYKENALRSAKYLAEYSHLSKRRIYLVLSGEDAYAFTLEEAQYAIDNLECDFKTNAFKRAQFLLEETSISKNKIRSILVNQDAEGFTEEEADYAMSKLAE